MAKQMTFEERVRIEEFLGQQCSAAVLGGGDRSEVTAVRVDHQSRAVAEWSPGCVLGEARSDSVGSTAM